jgi:hypothetical protein
MPITHQPKDNHLLSVLSKPEWDRIAPHLVPLDMPLGEVVYESGVRLATV